MRSRCPRWAVVAVAVCGLTLGAAESAAQQPPAAVPLQADTTAVATTAAAQSARPPLHRTVSGQVVDAESGWPLARAAVRAEGAARVVRVDASGRFRLRVPNAQATVVTVVSPGYAPLRVPLRAEQSGAVFHLVRVSASRTTWPVSFLPPDR
ncbi:MAG: carboxypeptidase-like regulatory domain-containing protein [Bacteroidota bacterium]